MRWLTPREAAQIVGVAPKTLANMRSNGTGPVFERHSTKILYTEADLIAWRESTRTERVEPIGGIR